MLWFHSLQFMPGRALERFVMRTALVDCCEGDAEFPAALSGNRFEFQLVSSSQCGLFYYIFEMFRVYSSDLGIFYCAVDVYQEFNGNLGVQGLPRLPRRELR